MNQKLTLRMEKTLIERAKAYGKAHGKPVSRIVADYFAALDAPSAEEEALPAEVRELLGVAAGSGLDEASYKEFLADKYLGAELE
ncbi:MAG: antitoxin [Gammaproteobacteria bacterium]|nr:antitoxin [Gammaproteobacteria bacterium]